MYYHRRRQQQPRILGCADKVHIINAFDDGEGLAAIAARYRLTLSRVSSIIRFREETMEEARETTYALMRHPDLVREYAEGKNLTPSEQRLVDTLTAQNPPRSIAELADRLCGAVPPGQPAPFDNAVLPTTSSGSRAASSQ